MMITAMQAEKILKGNQAFSQLAFSMLITRLKASYVKNPTALTVRDCTAQINSFLEKYRQIMGEDYSTIQKL